MTSWRVARPGLAPRLARENLVPEPGSAKPPRTQHKGGPARRARPAWRSRGGGGRREGSVAANGGRDFKSGTQVAGSVCSLCARERQGGPDRTKLEPSQHQLLEGRGVGPGASGLAGLEGMGGCGASISGPPLPLPVRPQPPGGSWLVLAAPGGSCWALSVVADGGYQISPLGRTPDTEIPRHPLPPCNYIVPLHGGRQTVGPAGGSGRRGDRAT